MDDAWYLAQVKPQSSQIAERNLHRHGFETFLPRHNVIGKSSGRFVTQPLPLFPGYIFVAFDIDFYEINWRLFIWRQKVT